MSTTEALLGDMARRRQELYLKNILEEEARRQLLQRVYDGEDENDLARFLPQRITNAQAYLRNRQGKNAARRGLQRTIGAVQAGTLQFSGDETWSDEDKKRIRVLVKHKDLLTARLAVFGQIALLPWNSRDTGPVLSPLTSLLWPVYSDYDATTVTRLIAAEAVATSTGTLYVVYDIEPGRLRVYRDVKDLTRFELSGRLITDASAADLDGTGRRANTMPEDRLPVAHVILSRDGNLHPEGLLEPALGAHWDYRRKQLQRNIAYELTALPQRVASGVDEGADDFDPLTTIYLSDPASSITYPFPQHLERLDTGVGLAEKDVAEMLHAPDVSDGAGESGEARLMSLEEQVHWASAVGDGVADCLTQASVLMADYGMLPGPLEFTLAPRFSAQIAAARQQITTDFEKGLITRYAALLLRQSLGDDIPEVEMEAAEEEFNTQRVPAESLPGEADDADTEDAE
jgi:hypothetical protein